MPEPGPDEQRRRHADGVPVFFSAPASLPLWRNLAKGSVVAVLLFALVGVGLTVAPTVRLRSSAGGGSSSSAYDPNAAASYAPDEEVPAGEEDEGIEGPNERLPLVSGARVARTLARRLYRFPLLALGEWRGTLEDAELHRAILRQRTFQQLADFIAIECAAVKHQATLDRYISGEYTSEQRLLDIWRDVSQPGACDSPVYYQFLDAVRALNVTKRKDRKLRVIATDPIDWDKIQNHQDWLNASRQRHVEAARRVAAELDAGRRGLLIYSAPYLWRKTLGILVPDNETLIARLDTAHPEKVFTTMRTHGAHKYGPRLQALIGMIPPPVLLPVKDTVYGRQPANQVLGAEVEVPFFAHLTRLADVTDALVYSGATPDTPMPAGEPHPDYAALKKARRALIAETAKP